MNRSILLVITDFLILTLLSFVQFDGASTEQASATEGPAQLSAPAMTNMLATLESALELERRQREALTNALAASNAELQRRMQLLAEREQRLTNTQERLDQAESEARRLAEERARLDRVKGEAMASVQALQQAFESTRKGTESLQDRLQTSTREAEAAKARLQAIEEELALRRSEARDMQQRIGKLDQAAETLRTDKERLLTDLRETEAQARVAKFEVTNLTQQLTVVSQEKAQIAQTAAQLATNVGELSLKSAAIQEQLQTQTVRSAAIQEQLQTQSVQAAAIKERIDSQVRWSANAVYGDFLSNRVSTVISASTRGGFGQDVLRDKQGVTVLVRPAGGNEVFAVLHVDSTPLRFWPPDAPWSGFGVRVSHGTAGVESRQFALVRREPRIVLIPVTEAQASALGARVYATAADPGQFSEAVVVGGEEKYYGEAAYRLNADRPGYVEMERSTFRRMMGEFAPRKGDLAFTKTGLLLGVMVNGDHCLLLERLETLPAFRCGSDSNPAQNGQIIRTAFGILEKQPAPLR